MTKLAYKPVSLLVSMGGGLVAGAIFKKMWQLAAKEEETPKATDASRRWHEILLAAALQGAIFAVVKATMDRMAAVGTHKITGTWPGENSEAREGAKEGTGD